MEHEGGGSSEKKSALPVSSSMASMTSPSDTLTPSYNATSNVNIHNLLESGSLGHDNLGTNFSHSASIPATFPFGHPLMHQSPLISSAMTPMMNDNTMAALLQMQNAATMQQIQLQNAHLQAALQYQSSLYLHNLPQQLMSQQSPSIANLSLPTNHQPSNILAGPTADQLRNLQNYASSPTSVQHVTSDPNMQLNAPFASEFSKNTLNNPANNASMASNISSPMSSPPKTNQANNQQKIETDQNEAIQIHKEHNNRKAQNPSDESTESEDDQRKYPEDDEDDDDRDADDNNEDEDDDDDMDDLQRSTESDDSGDQTSSNSEEDESDDDDGNIKNTENSRKMNFGALLMALEQAEPIKREKHSKHRTSNKRRRSIFGDDDEFDDEDDVDEDDVEIFDDMEDKRKASSRRKKSQTQRKSKTSNETSLPRKSSRRRKTSASFVDYADEEDDGMEDGYGDWNESQYDKRAASNKDGIDDYDYYEENDSAEIWETVKDSLNVISLPILPVSLMLDKINLHFDVQLYVDDQSPILEPLEHYNSKNMVISDILDQNITSPHSNTSSIPRHRATRFNPQTMVNRVEPTISISYDDSGAPLPSYSGFDVRSKKRKRTQDPSKTNEEYLPYQEAKRRKSSADLGDNEEKDNQTSTQNQSSNSTTSAASLTANKRRMSKGDESVVVRRDADGNVILPLQFGSIVVNQLGKIVYENEKFHSKRYIFPVGYSSKRLYFSMKDPTTRCWYTQDILQHTLPDGSIEPVFQLVCEDIPNDIIEGPSPSGVWSIVLDRVRPVREAVVGRKLFSTVSGPEQYGLSHPIIHRLIETLPNANKCWLYDPSLFESSAQPKTRKKRTKILKDEE